MRLSLPRVSAMQMEAWREHEPRKLSEGNALRLVDVYSTRWQLAEMSAWFSCGERWITWKGCVGSVVSVLGCLPSILFGSAQEQSKRRTG